MDHWKVLSQKHSIEALSGCFYAFSIIIKLHASMMIDDASSLVNSLSAGVLSHKAAFVQFLKLQESSVRQCVIINR